MTADEDLAQARTQLSCQQFDQSRLAGPVGSEQPGDARPQIERNVVDADDRAIPLRNVAELGQRHSVRLRKFRRATVHRTISTARTRRTMTIRHTTQTAARTA